jgi:hypothetical protein
MHAVDNLLRGIDDSSITPIDDRSPFSPLERRIVNKGWEINEKGQLFSFKDFAGDCSHGSFRNGISHINRKTKPKLIVHVDTSGIGFYAIRGSGLETRSMTRTHLVGPAQQYLVEMLALLGDQVTGVHNIHLDFQCPALYPAVGIVPDPQSFAKALLPVIFSNGRKVRVTLYRTGSVSVKVACSDDPFPRENLSELLMVLDQVWSRLVIDYVTLARQIPPPAEWVVKRWEVNKDGREIAGPDVAMTFTSLSGVLMRFYRKGLDRVRVEKLESVGKTLRDLIQETLG